MKESLLSSLIIFILIVFPGLIFRRFYYKGEFSKQFSGRNWTYLFFYSIFPGLIIQVLTFKFFDRFILPLNDKAAIDFIHSCHDNTDPWFIQLVSLSDGQGILYSILYIFLLITFSTILAIGVWYLVRRLRLDCYIKILRFDNHWYYYFRSEFIYFKEFKHMPRGKCLFPIADVLVQTSEDQTILYTGTVNQYTINKSSGQLENIYLTNYHRFKKDPVTNKYNITNIPGDCFIIPYERIVNINLRLVYKNIDHQRFYTFALRTVPVLQWLLIIIIAFIPFELNIILRVGLKIFLVILSYVLTTFLKIYVKDKMKWKEKADE